MPKGLVAALFLVLATTLAPGCKNAGPVANPPPGTTPTPTPAPGPSTVTVTIVTMGPYRMGDEIFARLEFSGNWTGNAQQVILRFPMTGGEGNLGWGYYSESVTIKVPLPKSGLPGVWILWVGRKGPPEKEVARVSFDVAAPSATPG